MKKLIIKWIIAAVAIYIAGSILSGFSVGGWSSAFVAALVLGLINFTVKPILKILTLPLTLLTLGLFLFVVNGIAIYLMGMVVSGVHVNGMISAILASIVISLITMAFTNLLGLKDK